VLTSLVSSLTSAQDAGIEGANGTSSAATMKIIANQVQGILDAVISDANSTVGGAYLFGGTSTATPYTADATSPTGYTYNGNNQTSTVAVGDQTSVAVNLPGSQVFSNSSDNVIASLSSLVTALNSGDSSAVQTAVTAVGTAISFVGQQQVFYSNAESQLSSQETFLQQDTVTLTTQESNLIGVNESTAATDLSQAETDNNAALAAVAKVLPNSLLNYLSTPS
jgi:flagellar hook-associated protein 3 FlgL